MNSAPIQPQLDLNSSTDGAHIDVLFLSPHLDDVVLSCGGQINRYVCGGQRIVVATIMAGDPPLASRSNYIDQLHSRWQLEQDATAARRQEDLAACRILGAEAVHLKWSDCIYRVDSSTGQPYYTSDSDIFGDVVPAERPLIEQIAATMGNLPHAERVVAPLGVGNHVDHQLTRAAADLCYGEHQLWYYEEFPYAATHGAVQAVAFSNQEWRAHVIALRLEDLVVKCDAIAAYKSQVSTFFRDRADLNYQVQTYAQQIGGERLWRQGL